MIKGIYFILILQLLFSCQRVQENNSSSFDMRVDTLLFNWKKGFKINNLDTAIVFKKQLHFKDDTPEQTFLRRKQEKQENNKSPIIIDKYVQLFICHEHFHCFSLDHISKSMYLYNTIIRQPKFDIVTYVIPMTYPYDFKHILATYPKNGTKAIATIEINSIKRGSYALFSKLNSDLTIDITAHFYSGLNEGVSFVRNISRKYIIKENGTVEQIGNETEVIEEFQNMSMDSISKKIETNYYFIF
jgi:hypothetical protein